jgi:TP901-1 family phage major tail protein
MAAQRGRLMLLKLSDGVSPDTFTTVGGLRTTSMSINGELVDITNKDTSGWRSLMENAGFSSIQISGSGIFTNDTAARRMMVNAMERGIDAYQLVFDNGDLLQGQFQVTTFTRSGEHNGAETYEITLESSGQPNFSQGA